MGVEVQKRTLQIAQKSLDIVNNNNSNMKTPGYTRQRVDVASLSIGTFTYWQSRLSKLSLSGQGVTAYGVSQIRNSYLDKRFRDVAPFAKELEVKEKILTELETSLDNIDNFGLLKAFDNLKSIFTEVAVVTPDARELSTQIRNQAENICQMLRRYADDLNRLEETNLANLEDSISQTNILIDKIVMYNKAIKDEYFSDVRRIMNGQGVSEYGPLELMDQRNLLLDELADYANIEVFQNANGSVRVTMAGVTIIDDEDFQKVVMKDFYDYGAAVLSFSDGTEFKPRAGEIKAYMDMLNGNGPYAVGGYQCSEYGIPYYRQALDAFAAGFASLMNQVNRGELSDALSWDRNLIWGGYEFNADGTFRQVPRLDSAGVPVTDPITGDVIMDNVRALVSASNIRISEEWLANSMMVGEIYDPATDTWSEPNLEGTNLLRFARAFEDTSTKWGRTNDFTGSLFGYLQFLSDRLGTGIDFTRKEYLVYLDKANTLLDNRDAISAVSDSEGGVDMLVYMKWYNASARLMTTLDDALDTLINRCGRVGL
jgi:flagellar hook-associated protein 1 FlgK